MVVNGVLSLVLTYATMPRYEDQIESFDDLYESSVLVLTDNTNAEDIIETLEILSPHENGWSKKVHVADVKSAQDQIKSLSNSMAFAVTYYEAKRISELQYRKSCETFYVIENQYLELRIDAYTLIRKFAYIEYLNILIHYCQSSGLFDRWMELEHQEAIRYVLENFDFPQMTDDNNAEPVIPTAVWYGWAGSVVVFICEIMWTKFKVQRITEWCRNGCLTKRVNWTKNKIDSFPSRK